MTNRYRRELVKDRSDRPVRYDVDAVAEIAGVPAKSVRTWATTGFVAPVSEDVEAWALPDAMALRLAAELVELGVTRRVVRGLAAELQSFEDDGESRYLAYRRLAGMEYVMAMATAEDLFDELSADPLGVVRMFTPEQLVVAREEPDPWVPEGDLLVWRDADDGNLIDVLWPLSKRAAEVVERAETWRLRMGYRVDDLPEWM